MNYKILSYMEMDAWHPIYFRHPFFKKENNLLTINYDKYIINAKLLIILPIPKVSNTFSHEKLNTIIRGMLSVLEFDKFECVIARILLDSYHSEKPDINNNNFFDKIKNEIAKLQPQNILLFGKNFDLNLREIFTTFHPLHLLENPQDKKQAYKDLILLKSKLTG